MLETVSNRFWLHMEWTASIEMAIDSLPYSLCQSWTWIGFIHGLEWIGLGPLTAILCFFSFIYFLY